MAAPSVYGPRLVPFEPVEVMPSVVVRLLRADELDAHEAAVNATDVYSDGEERVRRWWRTPSIWPTVVEWRGEILQYDYFHLEPDRQVRAGLTVRPARDRARWFWREMRRPVLDALLAAGYRSMHSAIRADRRDWIEVMKGLWQADEVGRSADGRWVHVRYDLAVARAQCTGIPPRRTATVAGVSEVGPAHAEVLIRTAWPEFSLRGRMAIDLMQEAWHLDQGTLLQIGPHLRVIRPRHDRVAALMTLTPMEREQPEVSALVREWLKRAGYARLQTFVPVSQTETSAAIRAQLKREGFALLRVHRRGPVPVGQWEARV